TVAHEYADLPVGVRDPGTDRVPHAGAEAAVRAGVEPGTGPGRLQIPPGVRDEVAAVADGDRVGVQDLAKLAVDPGRPDGIRVGRHVGGVLGAGLVLGRAEQLDPVGVVLPVADVVRDAGQDQPQVPGRRGGRREVGRFLGRSVHDVDNLRVIEVTEAEPE